MCTYRLVMTSGVSSEMFHNDKFADFVGDCIGRFAKKDWGDVCKEDALQNDTALETGEIILASYENADEPSNRVWLHADPPSEKEVRILTVLFPSEY